MEKTTLATRLRAARLAAGLRQQDVWERAGIPRTTYTDLEQGSVCNPAAETLKAVASVVGVSVDHLLHAEVNLPVPEVARVFFETPTGRSLTPGERQFVLKAAREPPYEDRPVTVAYLYALIHTARGHLRPELLDEVAVLNKGLRPRK